MAIFQNSLSNRNLTVSKNGLLVEELTEELNFISNAFDVVLVNEDLARIDIDINFDAFVTGQFNRISTDVDYTLAVGVTYIAVDTRVNRITITLPAGFEGRKIIIKDEYYNAFFRRVTLVGDAVLIDFQASVQIRVNGFGVQLVFTENQWRFV